MKKFIISALICLIISVCFGTSAFAAELPGEPPNLTVVEHIVDDCYTVSIPAHIRVNDPNCFSSDYSVTVSNVMIPEKTVLTATVEYDGLLSESNGIKLPYELNTEKGVPIQSGSRILEKESGSPKEPVSVYLGAHLTDKPRYSGIYTDTVTFNLVVIEKVYTADEIDADEHIYGIGKTKAEYVIAKFNDDFSSVEIFKNGTQSDGLIQDLSITTSPMVMNADTLRSAQIHEGVINVSKWAFYHCENLESVIFPASLTVIGEYAFTGTAVSEINFLGNNLSEIKNDSFSGTKVTNLKIPEGVEKIGQRAFQDCKKIEYVSLPSTLSSLGAYAFAQCPQLQKVDIPSDSLITEISDYCFYWCPKLFSIQLPQGLLTIKNHAFYYCPCLQNITIPNTVTQIDSQAFAYCLQLTSFFLPKHITYIAPNFFVTNSYYRAQLENIFVDPNNENYMDIDGVLFSKNGDTLICYPSNKQATTYIIPDGVNQISSSAFQACKFQSITLPNSLKEITSNIFSDCKYLKNIYGSPNSCAEAFAKEYGYNFISNE